MIHPIVPWKVIHGLNKQLYLPDEKAAQIRHMMVECKMAERNIPALIGMAYAFFTDMPMPPAMAVHACTQPQTLQVVFSTGIFFFNPRSA